MKAIDLHSDTIYRLWNDKSSERLERTSYSVDIERLERGDVGAECFAIFTPLKGEDGLTQYERALEIHSRFVKELASSNGRLLHARSVEELKQNEGNGRVSAILTIEDSGILDGRLERLDEFESWGVMIASLTWNYENTLAFPQSEDKNVMNSGLKEFGHTFLDWCEEKGVVADVSHLSDGGFWDCINSRAKVIATHSNSREVTNVGRNLTDEMIRALSDKGGVMGLNLCPSFLSSDGQHKSRVRDMVNHVMHIYNVGGEDVLALGSDFDGIGGELEISDPAHWYLLSDALKAAGLPNRAISKMWHDNIMRVFES